MISLWITIFILSAVFGLGSLVYFRDPRNETNRLFAIMTLWMIIWIASNFLENEFTNLRLASVFLRIDFASASLLFYFWFRFCINFPRPHKPLSGIKNILLFSPAIIFAVLSFSNLIIYNINFGLRGIEFDYGRLFLFYSLYIVGYMLVGGVGSLILKYRKVQGLQKTQILYVLLGLLISGIIGVSINLFFQKTLPVELFRIGIYGTIFLIGFTSYAIIKKKLFDIKVVLTAVFVILIAILIFLDTIFFTDKFSIQIFKGIIFCLFLFFGYYLVQSVILEIGRREEMERLSLQLRTANIELDKLSRAKSEFISIASHQLRTPLTAIKGYISMILEGSYGKVVERARTPMENVYRSNERLINLVNDLLSISRIESGKMEFKPEKASIEEVIDSVINDLKITAEKKKLYLKWEKPEISLPEILLDKDKMRQAILNLVDNAIKYTKKGGIIIKTQITNSKLLITIVDTGEGMEKEELAKIFESFSRGTVGIKAYIEGAGLGLYIARRFVEMHGGKIWAESEGRDKGSTFYIELSIK